MPPVHFGQFSLDIDRYELTCAGKPVRLERIPMDMLILLVREGGRLVRREEIIERLWGKAFSSIPTTASILPFAKSGAP